MSGFVQTVAGRIDPDALGKTMAHEHLLLDCSCYWEPEPDEASQRDFIHKPVSPEIMHKLYYNAYQNRDNTVFLDVGLAIEEAGYLRRAGGDTIVDVTPVGIGRDPSALLEISHATGLNIVMGCGYYVQKSHPPRVRDMTKNQIADEIIKEFHEGITYNRIKPGIIGEVGTSGINCAEGIKVLRGAAIAQKETGLPVTIHPSFIDGGELLDILEEEGGDASRTVICHCDCTYDNPEYHDKLAKRGAYVEYDTFGYDGPMVGISSTNIKWLPRDIELIDAVKRQIDMGNLGNILLGQDIALRMLFVKYGGFGYGHIIRDLPVFMNNRGISNDEIDALLIGNPKRLLTIDK